MGHDDRAVRLDNELIDGDVAAVGEITSRERLGGLLRYYYRAAQTSGPLQSGGDLSARMGAQRIAVLLDGRRP